MGVVNVTPDSFSDGGRFLEPEAAVAHALALAHSGAAIVDIGGESTRPGARPVDADEELARVLPVVRAASAAAGPLVSIDTTKASVADAALAAGASIVNDVSAGLADPQMLDVVAEHGAGFVAMHMRGTPATMQHDTTYDDIFEAVAGHLEARVAAAVDAGVAIDGILADPGIGFGKDLAGNLALCGALDALVRRLPVPVLIGVSRKRFIGEIVDAPEPADRDDATLAVTVWAFALGARVVRVHDVTSSARAARFLDVLDHATPEGIAA